MSPTELGFYTDLLYHGPPTAPKTPTLGCQQPLGTSSQGQQQQQQQQQQQAACSHTGLLRPQQWLQLQTQFAVQADLQQQQQQQQQQFAQQQTAQHMLHDEQVQHAQMLLTEAFLASMPQLQQQSLGQQHQQPPVQQQQQHFDELAGDYDMWLQTLWPSWTAAQLEAAQQHTGIVVSKQYTSSHTLFNWIACPYSPDGLRCKRSCPVPSSICLTVHSVIHLLCSSACISGSFKHAYMCEHT